MCVLCDAINCNYKIMQINCSLIFPVNVKGKCMQIVNLEITASFIKTNLYKTWIQISHGYIYVVKWRNTYIIIAYIYNLT